MRCDSGRARWCAMRCPQTTTASKRHCSIVVWLCSRSSDSVATRSARSLADSGLVSSIPTPMPIPSLIPIPNESAGDAQAKNLFSLFLHHHLVCGEDPGLQPYLPGKARRSRPIRWVARKRAPTVLGFCGSSVAMGDCVYWLYVQSLRETPSQFRCQAARLSDAKIKRSWPCSPICPATRDSLSPRSR